MGISWPPRGAPWIPSDLIWLGMEHLVGVGETGTCCCLFSGHLCISPEPAAGETLPRVGTGLSGKLSEFSHTPGQMVGVVCQAVMEKRPSGQ